MKENETAALLRELPLKQTERHNLLAEKWEGRVFAIESDSEIGLEAFTQWTRPVRLRLRAVDGRFVMEARHA